MTLRYREPYRISIEPAALRALARLRTPVQESIRAAIDDLAGDPEPDDSIAMRGKAAGLRRLRVGDYRVIYRAIERRLLILVIRVGHRSTVYEGFESE